VSAWGNMGLVFFSFPQKLQCTYVTLAEVRPSPVPQCSGTDLCDVLQVSEALLGHYVTQEVPVCGSVRAACPITSKIGCC
jgi:hypothetical protein